jgi:hypothetical protein
MANLEDYLNTIGEKGTTERLFAIAKMDLGDRSEAARKVVDRRYRRKELMDKGLSFEHSVLIVNNENKTE